MITATSYLGPDCSRAGKESMFVSAGQEATLLTPSTSTRAMEAAVFLGVAESFVCDGCGRALVSTDEW